MKPTTEKKPAAKPAIIPLAELKRIQAKNLTLRVTIPGPMVPMFNALFEISEARSPEAFASLAICRWLVSEDAVSHFDDMLNKLSAAL